MAYPKKVRSEWRRAIGRAGMCATTPFTCLFGRPFFGSFFGRTKKEQNKYQLKEPIFNYQVWFAEGNKK
jgi:hypothetical protein